MKKYYISTNTLLKYNEISGADYSDSIELYGSPEEAMKYACQSMMAYVSKIADLINIREYITHKLLSQETLDFTMNDNRVKCTIIKNENEIRLVVKQTLNVEGYRFDVSLTHQLLINEIEEENVGFIVVGKFDSESHSYMQILSGSPISSIKDTLIEIDKLKLAKMRNLCDFVICIVDTEKVKEEGIEKFENKKRKILK